MILLKFALYYNILCSLGGIKTIYNYKYKNYFKAKINESIFIRINRGLIDNLF